MDAAEKLGDFTTGKATLRLAPLAVLVGALSAGVALVLLKLIGLATNLAYLHTLDTTLRSPAAAHPGVAAVAIPIVGGLIVGVMARFGSERIRGHGIPEAMETVLVGGSKAEPRVMVLKPISSAVSIGTGGPFGAEGPIILTGGALGSVFGQFFHLSAIERRCLLVAGAAGGMSAVFGTPVAAVLLGVELLVFEWKPRSMVLIAIASAVAAALRSGMVALGWLDKAPLFPFTPQVHTAAAPLFGAAIVGLLGGVLAWVLTKVVYGAEDAFKRLPIHWMWWPAIGGVVVGIGGLIEPRALGVGYDTIGNELAGRLAIGALLSIFVVKLAIWALALGSGTSGGILAPILIIGAAAGGMLAPALPHAAPGMWSVIAMGAALAGVMRSPLTAIVFCLELTDNTRLLLPLLIAATVAHLVSVLVLKRSILTEKVARRGFHVLREYAVGPLEALFVRDVMATDVITARPDHSIGDLYAGIAGRREARWQRLLPVMDGDQLAGVVSWTDILERAADQKLRGSVADLVHTEVVTAYADETLREVADRMAECKLGVLPVVDRDNPRRLCGLVTQFDLLAAHERNLEEERHRERVFRLQMLSRR